MGSALNRGFPYFRSRESWNCWNSKHKGWNNQHKGYELGPTFLPIICSHLMSRSEGLQHIFASLFLNCSFFLFVCTILVQNLFLSDRLLQSSRFLKKRVQWYYGRVQWDLLSFIFNVQPHFWKGFQLWFWFSLMNAQQVPGLPQYLMHVFPGVSMEIIILAWSIYNEGIREARKRGQTSRTCWEKPRKRTWKRVAEYKKAWQWLTVPDE